MDDPGTNRKRGGVSPLETVKQIALGTMCFLIGGFATWAAIGGSRETLLWLLGTGLTLVPLSTWAGLILKKYIFPTH